ncbi:S8 family serine peptidase [Rossellomorea aquimaris]|uniref:Subtilisin family serine protease n=1 Tax=Rossellomorea aquimaris TaxID=189382 RepID=A0A366EL74_9BACI|nr:S8 family serine peptidase [Rossellomorea aquimaris]RBP02470.1 subtilisin family serine protease [Rossellomorea aquimaris]
MKKVLIWMMVLGLFSMPFYSVEVAKANGDTDVPSDNKIADRVIVKLKKPVDKAAIEGYEVLANQENAAAPIVTVDVPEGQKVESFIKDLENNSDVEYAEPDHLIKLNHVPNDPYYSLQWLHQNIESERTWDQTKGSSEVVVAVIDNGVDVDHPEFAGRIVAPYDTVYGTTTMTKGDHGTHVAGIIGSSMDNWMGLTGVAPETNIMPIDAFFNEESAYSSDVIEGIYYAVNNGADIINMSLGNYYYSSIYNDAIQYAYDNGVVVIAAAGNDNTSDSHYPSSYPNVISVASTTEYDTKSGFSNYGYDIDIAAPGSNILSTLPYFDYQYMSGTSMASPVVAGVAALILANEPNLTNDQVADRLYTSADDLGTSGKDYFYGHGRVNARKAVGVARYVAPPQVSQVYDYSTYVSGTVDTDDDSYIEVSNGEEVIGNGYPYWGSFNIDIPKQTAETTLWVTLTDGDATSEATTITVMDGTSPDVPTVNEVTDRHTSVTGKAEAGSTVEVKAGSETIGSSTSNGSFTVAIAKQKAGTELSVYAIDGAGNQSDSAMVTVKDKTAPVKPTVNPVGDNSTTVTGNAEANSTVVAKVGSTELGRAKTNSNGAYSITISKQKIGTEVSVYAVDAAGNQSETVKVTVDDKTAPTKPTVNPVGDQSTSISGKAEANTTVYAKAGSSEIGKTSANKDGEFTISISKQKAGTEINVYAVDQAGNISAVEKVQVANEKPQLKTLIGTTRYSTAVEVSKQGWDTSSTVFLVNGGAIADGLTATPLASAHDAPILLTTKGTLPAETEAELKRLGTKNIVLIGGSGVISDEVKGALVKLGYNVSRIGGKDRYETSLFIAKQLDKSVDVTEAYIAYGRGEPDALSIAAQSGKVKQPIILSEKKSVPKATYEWLKSESLSNAHFIGGAAVLDSAIMKEMNSITTKNVEGNRISGLSRHDTNAKVIEKFYTENHYPTILIAKSETAKLVDALSAGPLASKLGVPVLLVSQKGLERSQIATIEDKTSSQVHQIGGGINEGVVGEVLKYMD